MVTQALSKQPEALLARTQTVSLAQMVSGVAVKAVTTAR
jgi:hypothetical protein